MAAIGFVVTVVGLVAKWKWNQPLLIDVSTFSLALTILDWGIAFTGVLVNIGILAIILIGPSITVFLPKATEEGYELSRSPSIHFDRATFPDDGVV